MTVCHLATRPPIPRPRPSWRSPLSLFLSLACTLLLWLGASAPAFADSTPLDVYFFHSETCPHCMKQEPLMLYLDEQYPEIRVRSYEVNESPEIWQEFRDRFDLPSGAVPRTIVGDRTFIGYTEDDGALEYNPAYRGYSGYRNQIVAAIEAEAGIDIALPEARAASPKLPWWLFAVPGLYLASYPVLAPRLKTAAARRYWTGGLALATAICAFTFLTLIPDAIVRQFAQSLPFPLFVSTIALADGFNPCAFTVLAVLLSLLTYTKSRRDMTWVGVTFILTSGVMYFAFIMLMVMVGSVFFERYGTWVTVGLGAVVLVAGLINVKDFFFFKKFFFKQTVSLSLSSKQQKTIHRKAGAIVRSLQRAQGDRRLFAAALGGTVLLAAFANLVELGCTAILPTVYMTSLVNVCSGGNNACAVGWTAWYATVYILPLLAILFGFVFSFQSARVSEAQGRLLKLLGGLFMLFFGALMLTKPELLSFG